MELYRVQVILLFVSFALAVTVLVDGATHLSMAKSDFPDTTDGKTGWTNLMMYEIIVPVLSVFGLFMHIFGLHLEFVSYLPETAIEGIFLVIGTAAHGAAWLTMGAVWTICEIGTLQTRTVVVPGQKPTVFVHRSGPAFCPQHEFLDRGYSLQGPIPKVKVALAWVLFALALVELVCAFRGWSKARHAQYLGESARHRRTMRGFEMVEYEGQSATAEIIGAYETKV